MSRVVITTVVQVVWVVVCFAIGYNVLHLAEKYQIGLLAILVVAVGGVAAIGYLFKRHA